jgi:hypothetical protein
MTYELKIKELITKEGIGFLISEPCDDNFLNQLKNYLFQHRSSIPRMLEILNDESIEEYGGNLMYTRMEGPSIFIYDHTDDDPDWFQIEINRSDLIDILKSWQEVNETGSIKKITLRRDDQHINMIVEFDDAPEFRRTFNYKVG